MPLTTVLRHHRRAIVAVAIAGGVCAFILSIVQPLRYRATTRVLITQATSPTLDAFTAVKSAEKIGKNLGEVITSSLFLGRVLSVQPGIDASAFSTIERRRRKAWERMVETSVGAETSVMEIRVYHTLQAQARMIAEGITTVLVREVADLAGSRDVAIRVIDPPLLSRFPVRPNIPANTALGVILGALFASAVAYLRGPKRTHA